MGKFDLDFSYIHNIITPSERIPVNGNEYRMTKVAFDMFRLDNEPETLWKVQSDDDGNEFLVRTYTLPENELSVKSSWSVAMDNKKANLTIFYKDVPIKRLAASTYGMKTAEESEFLASVVRKKLATDINFGKKLLKTLPKIKLQAIASSFPELISNSNDRNSRPTVEVPIVERPEVQEEKELNERQSRETSTHVPISRFPENSENQKQPIIEEKLKEFISSPSFNEAFGKWFEENK